MNAVSKLQTVTAFLGTDIAEIELSRFEPTELNVNVDDARGEETRKCEHGQLANGMYVITTRSSLSPACAVRGHTNRRILPYILHHPIRNWHHKFKNRTLSSSLPPCLLRL